MQCSPRCDVYERTAAPADAKTRKSAEPQQLVANTKTERREVSGFAIRCHNHVSFRQAMRLFLSSKDKCKR